MKVVKAGDRDPYELLFGLIADPKQPPLKSFTLRKLTGRVRQRILMESAGKSDTELVNNGAFQMLATLGDAVHDRKTLGKMTVFDRDYLLFMAAMISKPVQEQKRACKDKECGFKWDQTVPLKDIDVHVPEEKDVAVIDEDFTRMESDAEHKLKILTRLRTVADEEEAPKDGRKKVPYASLLWITSKCILDFNGQGRISDTTLLDMEGEQLDATINTVGKFWCGPDLEVAVPCPQCGKVDIEAVDVVSHFLGLGLLKHDKSDS